MKKITGLYYIFLQDNALLHPAKHTKMLFEDNKNHTLDWPANSLEPKSHGERLCILVRTFYQKKVIIWYSTKSWRKFDFL